MKTWKAPAAMVILALVAALPACARKAGYASTDEIFARYDTNHDGRISHEEYVAAWHDRQKAETAWKTLDVQGNGFVDRKLAGDTPLRVWNQLESQNEP